MCVAINIIAPSKQQLEEAKERSRFKSKDIKQCKICGSYFQYGRRPDKICGLCYVEADCFECGKSFTIHPSKISGQAKKILIDEIERNEFSPRYCSRACSLGQRNAGRIEFCESCNKETPHGAIGCIICHNNNINKIKHCEICNKDTMHNGDRCMTCFNKQENVGFKLLYCQKCGHDSYHLSGKCVRCNGSRAGLGIRYCSKCKRKTFHNGDRCSVCDPWEGSFDRESFYSSKIDSISLNYSGVAISLNDIDSLQGVPGVWTKETTDGTVLDVAQTQDIGNEMLFSIRALDAGRQNLHKPDSYFDDKPSIYRKYRDIASHGEIVFRLVATGVTTKEGRERIEAQHAHQTRAKYWSPAPGQCLPLASTEL